MSKTIAFALKGTIIGLLTLMVGMLFYISFFNCPSVADDYCFATTARNYGFWTAQKMYYNGWTGRYFSNFLFHLNPLYFSDSRVPFTVIPIILVIVFILNTYFLIRLILKDSALQSQSLYIAFAFVALYFYQIPSVVENFFWMIGTYTFISGNMLMLFVNLLLRYYKNKNKTMLFVIISLLFFLILGSSEVSMFSATLLIASIAFYKFIKYRKLFKLESILFILAAIGNLIVIKAPGNAIRNTEKREIWGTLVENLKVSLEFLYEWTFDSPLFLIITAAYLVLLFGTNVNLHLPKFPVWYSWLTFFAIFYVGFIPTSYGMGDVPPPRILNLIYLIFLMGWFFNITNTAAILHLKLENKFVLPVGLLLTLFSLIVLYQNHNLREMYRDIKYKKVNAYLEEYQERVELLSQDIPQVVLKPYQTKPFSLYTEDIYPDPKHLWNQCLGNYYNNKVIYLENYKQ